AGPAGPAGQDGADGLTILSGSGPPASNIGVVGDFYIDTTADVLYGPAANAFSCLQKQCAVWPATGVSLVGPAGPSTAGPGGLDVTLVIATNAEDSVSAIAFCPADHPFAIGGGGSVAESAPEIDVPGFGNSADPEHAGAAQSNQTPNAWFVATNTTLDSGAGTGGAIHAYAICAQ
ncbi:MAG: hypothetical protein WBH47_13625, partial [Streptosporangiaceae bacterium]